MDTKTSIEELVPATESAPVGGGDGNGDGGGNESVTGGDHIDVVNNMVPKNVPWASVKVNPEDEIIIQEVESIKDACYFLMPDWKVCIVENVCHAKRVAVTNMNMKTKNTSLLCFGAH